MESTILYTDRGVGSQSRDVDTWTQTSLYTEDRGLPSTDDPVTWQFQIDMFRPIRVDHINCLQVTIKTHSFNIFIFIIMNQQSES